MSDHRMHTPDDGEYAECEKCGLVIAARLADMAELRACNGRKKCAICNWAMLSPMMRLPLGDVCRVCHDEIVEHERSASDGTTVILSDWSGPIARVRLPNPAERLPDLLSIGTAVYARQEGAVYRLAVSARIPRAVAMTALFAGYHEERDDAQ